MSLAGSLKDKSMLKCLQNKILEVGKMFLNMDVYSNDKYSKNQAKLYGRNGGIRKRMKMRGCRRIAVETSI